MTTEVKENDMEQAEEERKTQEETKVYTPRGLHGMMNFTATCGACGKLFSTKVPITAFGQGHGQIGITCPHCAAVNLVQMASLMYGGAIH